MAFGLAITINNGQLKPSIEENIRRWNETCIETGCKMIRIRKPEFLLKNKDLFVSGDEEILFTFTDNMMRKGYVNLDSQARLHNGEHIIYTK